MNSQPKGNHKTLVLLLLAFVIPVALAKLVLSLDLYHAGATNKGELLTSEISYQNLLMDNPKPHLWQVLFLLPTHCDAQCEERLYFLNQSYTALGRDRDRVHPLIALQDHSDTSVLSKLNIQFETIQANPSLSKLLTQQQLIIVDPLGNLIMQYTAVEGREANISQGKALIADLRKMLKLSRVG